MSTDEKTIYNLYYNPKTNAIYLSDGSSCSWSYSDATVDNVLFSKELHPLNNDYNKFEGTIDVLMNNPQIPADVLKLLSLLERVLLEKPKFGLQKPFPKRPVDKTNYMGAGSV